jgi:putative Mg2+ transporter-C (MgtC) family protein
MQGIEQFMDPTAIMLLKLVIAMSLGAIVGTERAILARQPAGTRTFGLVALGACLFVVIGNYANIAFLGVADVQPTFIAAAVITGIGFLCGGLIIFRGESVHGSTTAAGLWITGAIGMAVGFGLYVVALFASLLALVMFSLMWYIENRFKHWFDERTHDPHAPIRQ